MKKLAISRSLKNAVETHSPFFRVITFTGPRQSGKTTLAQMLFPKHKYVSLEDPDLRQMAQMDPKGFLKQKPMILDEIQRAPLLLSYIQTIVDESNEPCQYILTVSHQFELMEKINQSLAGRTALFKLLPLSLSELNKAQKFPSSIDEWIWRGSYPELYHQTTQDPNFYYRSYINTYVEKDLREMIQIRDLRLFEKFLRLCAGRIGQIFVLSQLATEIGVAVSTIEKWVSILEASYIVFLMQPYYANISKRMVKSPKIYFYDTGLACALLAIRSIEDLENHSMRGHLFENSIILEKVKSRWNQGLEGNQFFYRDSNGNEVDLFEIENDQIVATEIKSSQTFHSEFLKGLNHIKKVQGLSIQKTQLIYDGGGGLELQGHQIMNWKNI